jgi:hypothetical protein
MSRLPVLLVVALVAGCPDSGGSNPSRLWLSADQEGQMSTLSPEEPAPY